LEEDTPEQAEPEPEPTQPPRTPEQDLETEREQESAESESGGWLDKLGLQSEASDSAPAVTEANRLRYRAAVLGEFAALVMLAAAGWLSVGAVLFFAVGWAPFWLFVHPALFMLGASIVGILASVIGIVRAPWAVSTVQKVNPDLWTEEADE
jgi:hypothetical protein